MKINANKPLTKFQPSKILLIKINKTARYNLALAVLLFIFTLAGCKTASVYRQEADRIASDILQEKQKEALGKTEPFSIERPGDILRRRLLIGQNLPYAGNASLGSDKLKPVEHWPEKGYPETLPRSNAILFPDVGGTLKISLLQALQIGARNSSEYQERKEDVFQTALSLDLERNEFRNIFAGQVAGLYKSDSSGKDSVRGTETNATLGLDRKFTNGADLGTALAVDLAKLLSLSGASSLGIVADATISIPLLRGSGRHIVTEPLTQAERNVLYAISEFERYKQVFAINIAKEYLAVLIRLNEVKTAKEGYRSLVITANRSRKMAEAGRLSEIEADQAVQNELRNRQRWITAIETYKNRLDAFKALIGLPPDALIELDPSELEKLLAPAQSVITEILQQEASRDNTKEPLMGASPQMAGPSRENAGPFEIDETLAVRYGLNNRIDLQVLQGKVYDAQRKVVVLADALRAELTLFGNAKAGQSRTIESADLDNAKLRTDRGIYTALLTLDLPLERTAERNAYRNSYISLERSVREAQGLEDQIKLTIRKQLRDMLESRERLHVQSKSLLLAEKRVKSTNMFLEAGRAQIRDLTDAQEALFQAQSGLAVAAADYRIAELEFQRDTGLIQIDENGLWQESTPEEIKNGRK